MIVYYGNLLELICLILIAVVQIVNGLQTDAKLHEESHIRLKRQTQMDPLLRGVCDGVPDGPYKHPYLCGSYLQCFNGAYSEADCPGNMYFNAKAKSCDFRRRVKCKVIDGLVETEEDSLKFGPEIPVQVDHPAIARQDA